MYTSQNINSTINQYIDRFASNPEPYSFEDDESEERLYLIAMKCREVKTGKIRAKVFEIYATHIDNVLWVWNRSYLAKDWECLQVIDTLQGK